MTNLPKLISRIAIVFFCLLSLISWAADDAVQIRTVVDAAIRPLIAEHDVPGMALAVTIDGLVFL